MHELMTTAEVATYLRLKERKIYELVRAKRIPCSRVTGKLLFPKQAIDAWVSRHTEFAAGGAPAAPPIVAGSHDPLLEWALRESGSELAMLTGGSEDGLKRLAAGQAIVAGIHIVDFTTGDYNVPALRGDGVFADVVLIEWARRQQGLVVAAGNRGIAGLADVIKKRLRVIARQEGAGAQSLLRYLLRHERLAYERLNVVRAPALTETDLAAAVHDGKADCGIAIEAVARRFRLGFIPLQMERFDLAMRRRDYFEPSVQRLLGFTRSAAYGARAAELGGYDISECGRVTHNP